MSTLQEEVLALQKQLAAKQSIINKQNKEAKERTEKSLKYNIDILEKYHLLGRRQCQRYDKWEPNDDFNLK